MGKIGGRTPAYGKTALRISRGNRFYHDPLPFTVTEKLPQLYLKFSKYQRNKKGIKGILLICHKNTNCFFGPNKIAR
jgi:hypothetical protein